MLGLWCVRKATNDETRQEVRWNHRKGGFCWGFFFVKGVAVGGNRRVGVGPNSPFTSLLLAVSSPPAPCLPTSTRGSFLSLSPSIRTRTTPDLSTISWMTFPLLPMTLPAREKDDSQRFQFYQNINVSLNKERMVKKWNSSQEGGEKSHDANSPTRFLGT